MASPVSGGHSTTIVASGSTGSMGGGGGGSGYAVIQSTDTYYFNPVPDTVATGATVTFQYGDVEHWVSFDDDPGAVEDIPPTANADSTRLFGTAGTYTYHCKIHPYMHGTVVVR